MSLLFFKLFSFLANGSYIFVNTRGYPFSRATLTSPGISFNGSRVLKCLEFYYHMHGPSVNYLDVYISSSGNRRSVWNRRGTQGDRWRFAEVQLDISISNTRVSE